MNPKERWARKTRRAARMAEGQRERLGGRPITSEQLRRSMERIEEQKRKQRKNSGAHMPWDTW